MNPRTSPVNEFVDDRERSVPSVLSNRPMTNHPIKLVCSDTFISKMGPQAPRIPQRTPQEVPVPVSERELPELLCWRMLVKICRLTPADVKAIHDMEYTTIKDLAIFGVCKNVQSLLNSGISDAKAHKIVLFGTFLAHKGKITQSLTFDHILDFNVCLSQPNVSQTSPFQNMPVGVAASGPSPTHVQVGQVQATRQVNQVQAKRQSQPTDIPEPQVLEEPSAQNVNLASTSSKSNMRRLGSMDESSSRWSSSSKFTTSSSPARLESMVARKDSLPQNSHHSCRGSKGHHHCGGENCNRPARRPSLGAGEDDWKPATCEQEQVHNTNLPPKCPAKRSTMRWAMALEVEVPEDLTDSETESSYDSDDEDSESDSEYDSDSEDESESEWEDDEEIDPGESSDGSVNWSEENVHPHEWTLPANTLLPNMQQLFREAAKDKSVDINKRIQEALMAGRLQVTPDPATM